MGIPPSALQLVPDQEGAGPPAAEGIKMHGPLPFQPAWLLRLLLSLAGPPPLAAASASLPSASAPASPALQSPSASREMC